MNRLVDQRATALGLPTALDRPRVIFGRPVPLHVTIALQQFAQASSRDGPPQELAGIVKTMLADHPQPDARAARRFHHLARGPQICRDRLLHLDMLARLRANLQRLHAKIGKRADIHVVDPRVPANCLIRFHELRAVLPREAPPGLRVDVRANG